MARATAVRFTLFATCAPGPVALAQQAQFIPLGDLPGGLVDSLAFGLDSQGSIAVGMASTATSREAFPSRGARASSRPSVGRKPRAWSASART